MSSIHNSPSIIRTLAVPAGSSPGQNPAAASTPGSGSINNGPATDTFSSSKPKLFTVTAALATPGGITPGGVTPYGVTPAGVTPGGVTPGGVTPSGASGDGSNKAYADMIIQALMDLDAPDDLIEAYKEQYRLLGFYDATPEGGAIAYGATPGGITPGGVTPGGVTPGGIIR